jgi:hypothetical protein
MQTDVYMQDHVLPVFDIRLRARRGTQPKPAQGVIARFIAEVLEKGQSLRFLEDVGGL